MPHAKLPRYPKVEEFLKSQHKIKMFFEGFNSVYEGRNFALIISNPICANLFTVDTKTIGIGKQTRVEVTKNRKYFDNKVENYKRNLHLQEKLANLIKAFDS